MRASALSLSQRAAAIRDAFDQSFAAARAPDPPPGEDLLAIRIGTEPYALRLSEIAALHPDRRVTPLPDSIAALRGIAGFRGAIVPVLDLAVLLGQPAGESRWLAIAANEPVAFAFNAVERHLRTARTAIVPGETGERAQRYVRDFVPATGGVLHPILHLPSIIDAVKQMVGSRGRAEGH